MVRVRTFDDFISTFQLIRVRTFDDFIRAFPPISRSGWIPTARRGPTGVGKTLEDLLGIPENNDRRSDIDGYELKSSRISSRSSMCTLLDETPQPENAINSLLENFGYERNGELQLYKTLTIQATGLRLELRCNRTRLSIIAENNREYAYWDLNMLRQAFDEKYRRGKIIYVKAQSRIYNDQEEFHYTEAHEIDINFERFIELLEQHIIKVDLRIGRNLAERIHNHGTGFRISKTRLFRDLVHRQIFPPQGNQENRAPETE